MSHTIEAKTTLIRKDVLVKTCKQFGYDVRLNTNHTNFDKTKCFGHVVKFPEWRYPVVFNEVSQTAQYDNFRGKWGKQAVMDKFMQQYGANLAEQSLVELGIPAEMIYRQELDNGTINVFTHATIGG